ncbi:MAG: HNH endonuclease [Solirubrobacteraceae bacterium]
MHDEPSTTIEIPVLKGGVAVAHATVDPIDAHLARHRWYLHNKGYASRPGGACTTILLHREVLGLVRGDGLEVDHVNRDKLDCRRSNLRLLTHAENRQNNDPSGNRTWRGGQTTSEYRGVSWDRSRHKWKATVTVGGRTWQLGRFDSEEAARDCAEAFRAAHMPYAEPLPVTAQQ